MIQRLQSIWLLLASACAFAGLKFFFFTGNISEIKEGSATINQYLAINGFENIYLTIVTVSIAVMSILAIFLYKNRGLQIRICVAGMLLESLLLYLYYQETKKCIEGAYSLTSLLQVFVMIFLFLAIKGISKDNKIIKESNSLR